MNAKDYMRQNSQKEYRDEQKHLLQLLMSSFPLEKLRMYNMEQEIEVNHPELNPTKYVTKVDVFLLLLRPQAGSISLCIDMHGNAHQTKKQESRDWKKRQALEYNGHFYIELRNYYGCEECPYTWKSAETLKQLNKAKDKDNKRAMPLLLDQYKKQVGIASREIMYQMTLQMAESRRRDIPPAGIIDKNGNPVNTV